MSRAGRHAHKTAQAFLDERERVVVDRDRRPAVFAIGRHLSRIADDLSDHIRPGEDADAIVRYALASSSKFTSDAPNAVVG